MSDGRTSLANRAVMAGSLSTLFFLVGFVLFFFLSIIFNVVAFCLLYFQLAFLPIYRP